MYQNGTDTRVAKTTQNLFITLLAVTRFWIQRGVQMDIECSDYIEGKKKKDYKWSFPYVIYTVLVGYNTVV